MTKLPEPIKSVLRDYCHVEWYEVNELANDVRDKRQRFDVKKLREQFESLIASSDGCVTEINQLTLNEFQSKDDVREWLKEIYKLVFP